VRILVVEDSVKMAALLRKGLEREGYAVDVAGSGRDAVWMAQENEVRRDHAVPEALVGDIGLAGDAVG